MNEIMKTIGKILGFCFGGLVIGYTAWLTWMLAARLIPDNTIMQFMTIALFDAGALVWFIMFTTQAKGTLQWAISGIGFAVGLIGAIIMAGGELILGQSLVVLENPETLGWILVVTVIVAALAHATLIYAFHFADPLTRNRIENAQKVSQAIDRAYENARAEIDRDIDALGKPVLQSVLHEAQQQIASVTAVHIRNAGLLEQKTGETLRGGKVIDAPIRNSAPNYSKMKRVFTYDTTPIEHNDSGSNGNSPKATQGEE